MNDTNLTYHLPLHLPLLFDELVKNGAREKWKRSEKKENNNRRE